jgi:deoxyadenosine/deoxycytidine kinase
MRIIISGNIGSGKTTLIKKLNIDGYKIIPESVDTWIKHGWLQQFYSNPKKYAVEFQFHVLDSQINIPNENIILERSLHISQEVFCKQLYEDNILSKEDYEKIKKFTTEHNWTPDAFIYIRSDPDTCFQRINNRSRDSENNITLEYLQKLHQKHETFHKNHYIVDGNLTIDEVYNEVLNIIKNLN